MPPSTFTIACVIDKNSRFYAELVLWVLCAKRHLPEDRFKIIVYSNGPEPTDLGAWLQTNGIEIRRKSRIIEGAPRCTRIVPFFDDHSADCIIVCDVDLFFVGDLSDLLGSWRFRAPPNNGSVPPPHVLQSVLAASGLGRPYRPGMAVIHRANTIRETHINNISGGVVVAPAARSKELALIWKKWAEWLVQHEALLGPSAFHIYQVSFALAMEELREDVEFLPPQVNTVLHILPEIASVRAFHLTPGHIPQYPQRFNSDKTMNADGLEPGVSQAIGRLNDCIREAVTTIASLPSTKDHLDKFLNPQWRR